MGKIVATLVVGAVALLGSTVAPPAAGASFCEGGLVHDYEAPLERLPRLRGGPSTEHLPFAPARIFFSHIGGPLFVGGGEVGYGLRFSPRFPDHRLSPPLDWNVEARYVRVDKDGNPLRVVGDIRRTVKRLPSAGRSGSHGPDFLFKAGRPALYRLEITFSTFSGKRLARYGEYLRVLKRRFDADLKLSSITLAPGERVTATLDNHGTTPISFGLARSIQYFDGTSWVTAPESSQGVIPEIGLGLGPGGSASCWNFTVPPNEPPGRYRFGVRVNRGRALSSEFRIVAPG